MKFPSTNLRRACFLGAIAAALLMFCAFAAELGPKPKPCCTPSRV